MNPSAGGGVTPTQALATALEQIPLRCQRRRTSGAKRITTGSVTCVGTFLFLAFCLARSQRKQFASHCRPVSTKAAPIGSASGQKKQCALPSCVCQKTAPIASASGQKTCAPRRPPPSGRTAAARSQAATIEVGTGGNGYRRDCGAPRRPHLKWTPEGLSETARFSPIALEIEPYLVA